MSRPLSREQPLATLFAAALADPSATVVIRTGTVSSWNTTTGANSISIEGKTFQDVPVLSTVDITAIAFGQRVTLLGIRDSKGAVSYGIIGKFRSVPF